MTGEQIDQAARAAGFLLESWMTNPPKPAMWHGSTEALRQLVRGAVEQERERCARICDEMGEHWSAYKDTALLNGDVDLSNAASGEPRAAEALARLIRAASPPVGQERQGRG